MELRLIPWPQEVGFDLGHIDVEGSLRSPAILAATLVSTCFLILSLSTASQAWQRLNGWKAGYRVVLILLGCGSYLLAAWIQIALGNAFYRVYEHLDSSVSLGLYVPVLPVWLMGTVGVVMFIVIRNWRKSRAIPPMQNGKGLSL